MKTFFRLLSPIIFITISLSSKEIYLDSSFDPNTRVDDLMDKMTLEEKIAQMCQYVGLNYLSMASADMSEEEILNSDSEAKYEGFKIKDIAQKVIDGKIGSFLHVLTAEEANKLQSLAQKSRLKIPLLIGIDAIHGNALVQGCTVYPSPISLASSFNDDLLFNVGRQTALEMRATGSHWSFTPNVDVLRDPRWGRVGETFGEDPILVSRLGVNMINGLQLNDYTGPDKVIACAKHLIAGSEPVNGLNFSPMDVSDRTLREIYLKPYKDAVDAGVFSIMAAHNEVNGIPCHMHKELMTDIVRNEYGFEGFYVSDWLDIERLAEYHKVAKDLKDASYLSVDAGLDMHMHGPYFLEAVRDLVLEDRLTEERINESCRKILLAKFKLGLFENPFVDLNKINDTVFIESHQATALQAARESIVLLKNNDILPLNNIKRRKILVTGPNANNQTILGDWHWQQPDEKVVTIYEGLKSIGESKGHKVDFYDSNESIRNISFEDIEGTVKKSKNYDIVFLVIGDNSQRYNWNDRTAGENMARADINLPGKQLQLVKEIQKTGVQVIIILVNGKPIAEPWIFENIDVVLEAWEPGSFGGQAVAEIIFGEVNPSGKLPLTFPRSVGQLQMIYNHKPMQYFKRYAFEKTSPLFPFGFGLSYSKFEYNALEITKKDKETILVSVDIKNNSNYDGEEIVQLYFRDRISSVTRPVKELVDYRRISLKAFETKTIKFEMPVESLAFFDIDMNYLVEPGEFEFMVGGSSNHDDLISKIIEIN